MRDIFDNCHGERPRGKRGPMHTMGNQMEEKIDGRMNKGENDRPTENEPSGKWK